MRRLLHSPPFPLDFLGSASPLSFPAALPLLLFLPLTHCLCRSLSQWMGTRLVSRCCGTLSQMMRSHASMVTASSGRTMNYANATLAKGEYGGEYSLKGWELVGRWISEFLKKQLQEGKTKRQSPLILAPTFECFRQSFLARSADCLMLRC